MSATILWWYRLWTTKALCPWTIDVISNNNVSTRFKGHFEVFCAALLKPTHTINIFLSRPWSRSERSFACFICCREYCSAKLLAKQYVQTGDWRTILSSAILPPPNQQFIIGSFRWTFTHWKEPGWYIYYRLTCVWERNTSPSVLFQTRGRRQTFTLLLNHTVVGRAFSLLAFVIIDNHSHFVENVIFWWSL